ncbi:MAG: glycosyltransferase family 4 protein [Phycisphaeraceae bacterium]|nr:glycosyltransferase family 4 protein [Phycisphaeraceae bacterium]
MNEAQGQAMSLAVVIERFDPGGGGAERSTAQIVRELSARGHRVTVLCAWAANAVHDGLQIKRFSSRRSLGAFKLIRFSRWVERQLDSGTFDASLSVTTTAPATVLQPRSGMTCETISRNVAMRPTFAGRLCKRLLLATSIKQQSLLMLERRTLKSSRVKHIAAISSYVTDQLRGHYGFDTSRVTVIPNAAEMPVVDAAQRLQWRQQIRVSHNLADDVTVYLFAALNPRLKGVNELLQAIQRLRQRKVRAHLLLAGRNEHVQERLVAQLGIKEQVTMIGTSSRMPALYCAADVTVHPTFYDPSSKVVIESLMMGTPVVTTSFNGARDLVLPSNGSRRGRVVDDPRNVEALATAMAELSDPAERDRCREVMQGLSESLTMKKHVDHLEKLLRESR